MSVSRPRSVAALLIAVLLAASLGTFAPGAVAAPAASLDPRIAKVARTLDVSAVSVGVRSLLAVDNDSIENAVPLIGSHEGSLDEETRRLEVFTLDLDAGDRLGLRVIGDATLNADAYLFAPGTTAFTPDAALTGTIGDGFGKSLVYIVETTGTYLVAVTPVAGSGAYTISEYSAPWADVADNDIEGVALPASPVSDSLDDVTDPDDVFAVSLAGGDRFTVTVEAGEGLDADLLLYGPESDTIFTGVPVAGSAGVGVAGTETFVFDIPGTAAAADYYLDVRARSGAGTYSLIYTIGDLPAGAYDDETDATALTLGDSCSSLDALTDVNDLYSIGLAAGERLSLDLRGPAGTDFDIYVYGPGATGVLDTEPVAWSDDSISRESLIFDCTATGTYYVEVRTFSGSGPYTLTAAVGATPVFLEAARLAGVSRYDTAIAVSADTFADGSVSHVVLATGSTFPDALSASALAGALRSPMLLTPSAALPPGLIGELTRLGATTVEIVGGEKAVGPGVATALLDAGFTVRRTAGGSRYLTSAAVARRVVELTGNPEGLTAFLVSGKKFADANAVSPYAYSQKYPVLLTDPNALPADTAAVADEIGVTHVVIAGGPLAVSGAVEAEVLTVDSVMTTHREAGNSRYATAAQIADYAVRMHWGDNASVGIATGGKFADALGGGAAIGARGGVLLMTNATVLSPETETYLSHVADDVLEVDVYGGTGVVSASVVAALETALGAR
ncbi:MAG: cell wall-binding repeat-containing protein [Coriobacteriia bacterium]|nr:cell wall-binding repeat-containing protein [Coriobacteriia bacterium]